ncbi:MAG: glycine cleavage system protein GcvH [candidate division WOR-3 bacterium]
MALVLDNLRYTKDHEWVKVEGDIAIEGITDYAQTELSDIVMVELPQVGRKVKANESVGTIEAVKAVAELYSALSGEVVEVNEEAKNAPDLLNKDPYGQGWLFKIRISDPGELSGLMSAAEYNELIKTKGH